MSFRNLLSDAASETDAKNRKESSKRKLMQNFEVEVERKFAEN